MKCAFTQIFSELILKSERDNVVHNNCQNNCQNHEILQTHSFVRNKNVARERVSGRVVVFILGILSRPTATASATLTYDLIEGRSTKITQSQRYISRRMYTRFTSIVNNIHQNRLNHWLRSWCFSTSVGLPMCRCVGNKRGTVHWDQQI